MSIAGAPEPETWQQTEARHKAVTKAARELPREPSGWFPRLVLLAGTVVWLGALAWAWQTLPDRVPAHWGDASGLPDRWGSKIESLLMQVLIPLLVVFPTILTSRLVLHTAEGVNVSHKEWWFSRPRRLIRLERLLREDLMLLMTPVLLIMASITASIVFAARRADGYSPVWVAVVSVVGLLVWMALVVVRMSVGPRYRPDDHDPDLR